MSDQRRLTMLDPYILLAWAEKNLRIPPDELHGALLEIELIYAGREQWKHLNEGGVDFGEIKDAAERLLRLLDDERKSMLLFEFIDVDPLKTSLSRLREAARKAHRSKPKGRAAAERLRWPWMFEAGWRVRELCTLHRLKAPASGFSREPTVEAVSNEARLLLGVMRLFDPRVTASTARSIAIARVKHKN